jgi:hypothetical protein
MQEEEGGLLVRVKERLDRESCYYAQRKYIPGMWYALEKADRGELARNTNTKYAFLSRAQQ